MTILFWIFLIELPSDKPHFIMNITSICPYKTKIEQKSKATDD